MRLRVEDLEVLWPYDYIYPEQYQYMMKLKQSLSLGGHVLLEMPTGTGKTVSLLSLILAYQYAHPEAGKLVYCTRTVQEMDKVVEELRRVIEFRTNEIQKDVVERAKQMGLSGQPTPGQVGLRDPAILGVCLSSRRNLCIHPEVSRFDNRHRVDTMCRSLTASFVREQRAAKKAEAKNNNNNNTSNSASTAATASAALADADIEVCTYYEGYAAKGSDAGAINGIFGLSEMRDFGRKQGWCPYFMARHLINRANVVVYNYQYMLDPKIANLVSKEIASESIVVFDEAHNIDNICIEALSVTLDRKMIQSASSRLTTLNKRVETMEKTDAQRLNDEYKNLVSGLVSSGTFALGDAETDSIIANPVLPMDVLKEAVPGNIRQAKHFIMFLRTLVEYLKNRLTTQQVTSEFPLAFLAHLQSETNMQETKALKFSYDRLSSLFRTLQIADLDDYAPLTAVTTFAALVATYAEGFIIIIEPADDRTPNLSEPRLQLCCLDAALAMRPVFARFRTVVITSGTLSPMDMYPKVLNFRPSISESFQMTLTRNCICPLIVTKGSDQVPLTSKFDVRQDTGVVENYGRLLIELASVVPDGMVCFFTSYSYMRDIISAWNDNGMLARMQAHKLIFIETTDIVETTLALDAFKKACSCGRGAMFLSVARGKVAEGVDFDRHYGRCVVMLGVPFQYTLSRVLRARLDFLRTSFRIEESEFLSFDALRQTSQCVGRVIRSKTDYGIMIFADARYNRVDKRSKLPKWITQYMDRGHLNLSTDACVAVARDFLKKMAQPRTMEDDIGTALLSAADIARIYASSLSQFVAPPPPPLKPLPIPAPNEGAGGRPETDHMDIT